MIQLDNLTFLIPIKIETQDRLHNLDIVLGYLNQHFITNIKIYEVYTDFSQLTDLDKFQNLNIDLISKQLDRNSPFHRTKYLNEMLKLTTTDYVVNYDADVLLPIDSYLKSIEVLRNDYADFVYPYIFGLGQKRLFYSRWYEMSHNDLPNLTMSKFKRTYDLSILDSETSLIRYHNAAYGHCFFSKTKTYIDAFGENENFISYGPEDVERANRFIKLGYKVFWLDNFVYHIEHMRSEDSSERNPYFSHNDSLFKMLNSLDKEQLISYYTGLTKKVFG